MARADRLRLHPLLDNRRRGLRAAVAVIAAHLDMLPGHPTVARRADGLPRLVGQPDKRRVSANVYRSHWGPLAAAGAEVIPDRLVFPELVVGEPATARKNLHIRMVCTCPRP